MSRAQLLQRGSLTGNAFVRSAWLVPSIFGVVFLLRVVALGRLSASPLFLPGDGDMHFYDEWARQILQGRFTNHLAFYGLPLYAFLLAFLYKLFGYNPFVPGLLQAGLEAGTAVLLYRIVVRLLQDDRENTQVRARLLGVIAALGWAVFVPAQAYSIIVMPTAWAVFVIWFVVWRIVKSNYAPSPFGCLFYGFLVGLLATAVATSLFLVPFTLIALATKPASRKTAPSPLMARFLGAALLLLGLGAGTSPCWVHNSFVARDPVFLSAHSGINFWLGNNPDATGYPRFPGLRAGQAEMLQDSIALAESAAGKTLKRSEVSQFWSAKARTYIADNFGPWIQLLGRKIKNFWNAFEYDDLSVIANLRSRGIIFPGLHFGIVAAFGISGLFFSFRQWPHSRWIALAVGLQMLAVLPVFVTERYRLATVPGLLILALLGLIRLWNQLAAANYAGAAIHLSVVGAAAWLVTLPQPDPSLWALQAYNAGRAALETNNFPAAEEQLQRAHDLVPNNAENNFALGNLRLAQNNLAEAKRYYLAALALDEKHKGVLNNLGMVALAEAESPRAVDYFRRSLLLDPQNTRPHYLLAKALLADGRPAEAAKELERAIELGGDRDEFRSLRYEIEKSGR